MADAPAATQQTGYAEMKADMEARLAKMSPASSVPAAKPAESAVPAKQPEGMGQAKESAASTPPAQVEQTKVTPEAKPNPDLTAIPTEFRQLVETASPEFRAWIREELGDPSRLRTKDYTQKTQQTAALEKALKERQSALEKRETAAAFGEAVMADEGYLEALRLAKRNRESGKPVGDSTPFDPNTATPEEWKAYADAQAKIAREEERRKFLQEQEGQQTVQSRRMEIAKATKAALVDSGEYDLAKADAYLTSKLGGFSGVEALIAARGEEVSADSVVRTLRDLLPDSTRAAGKIIQQDSPHVNGNGTNGSNGASPLTRGNGGLPPVTIPEFMSNGKMPTNADTPTERSKRLALALFNTNRKRVARGEDPIQP